MILTINIGNTNITAGFFHGKRLVKRFSTPTNQDRYQTFLYAAAGKNVSSVIIASVVPCATKKIVNSLNTTLPGIKPNILGKNAFVPVKNLYTHPEQVGQDRLVNAYAAIKLYGYPAIVIDFGTAITFDIVSSRKEYKGGLILPGLQTSLDALAEKTALLPRIRLSKPNGFIGRDTNSSMLNGIIYGFAGMTEWLVNRLKGELGKKAIIVGTGGHSSLISRYCRCFTTVDPDLALKGLNLLGK